MKFVAYLGCQLRGRIMVSFFRPSRGRPGLSSCPGKQHVKVVRAGGGGRARDCSNTIITENRWAAGIGAETTRTYGLPCNPRLGPFRTANKSHAHCCAAFTANSHEGLFRELSPGPLTPEARIMPLDQTADIQFISGHTQCIISIPGPCLPLCMSPAPRLSACPWGQ